MRTTFDGQSPPAEETDTPGYPDAGCTGPVGAPKNDHARGAGTTR